MDATKLQEIEEWANDHVPRCYGCDGIARVIVPGTSRPMCAACAPNVPGAVLPLAPLVSVYATTLDLVAEVRRLTAALATVTAERAEACAALITARGEVSDARSALATARREGEEQMREACAERVRYLRGDLGAAAILRGESPVTPATEALSTAERLIGRLAVDDVIGDDDAIRALPLDALATARREGAEEMRAALIERFKERVKYLHPWAEAEDDENGCHGGAWTEALNAVQFTRDLVLPLDAPGGAT